MSAEKGTPVVEVLPGEMSEATFPMGWKMAQIPVISIRPAIWRRSDWWRMAPMVGLMEYMMDLFFIDACRVADLSNCEKRQAWIFNVLLGNGLESEFG